MSVQKDCSNCKYNIRDKGDDGEIYYWCNFEGRYLSYAEVMTTEWCKQWAKERRKK